MRFINHSHQQISIYADPKTLIYLKPGEVSKSFMGNIKIVSQFIKLGSTTELAIVREGTPDDNVLSSYPAAGRYVFNSVDEALTHLTVFNPISKESMVTGESLNKVAELTTEVDNLKGELKGKDLIISNLNKSIDNLNADKDEYLAKIERLNKEYIGYKSQVTVQINDLSTKLESSKNQVTAHQTTINSLLSEKVQLESTIEELHKKVASETTKLSDSASQNEEKDQAISGLTSQVNELANEKTLLEAEVLKLKSSIKDMTTQLNEKNSIIETNSKYAEENMQLRQDLKASKDDLEKVIDNNTASKEVWNNVCQMFGITFENGEWHCSYKGE